MSTPMPRAATPADLDALVGIIVAVAPEGSIGPQPPVDEDVVRERFRGYLTPEAPPGGDPPGGIWVVEGGGAVVGYAAVRPSGPPGVLRLAMAIRPEGRGRGAGRALLEVAVAHAGAHGAHKVELEAWTDNARAIALYASAGFEVEGVRRDHYLRRDGSLRSALVMAVRIGGPSGG